MHPCPRDPPVNSIQPDVFKTKRSRFMCKAIILSAAAAMLAVASLTVIVAQSAPMKVASGHREMLLQTTQSWNGKPYAHYPTGQPQLTTIKLTIEPHTALPWHTHPFPNVVMCFQALSRCTTKPAARRTSFTRERPSENQSTTFIGVSQVTNPPCYSLPMPAPQAFRPRSPRRGRGQSTRLGK